MDLRLIIIIIIINNFLVCTYVVIFCFNPNDFNLQTSFVITFSVPSKAIVCIDYCQGILLKYFLRCFLALISVIIIIIIIRI
jgi:hypothetical protein